LERPPPRPIVSTSTKLAEFRISFAISPPKTYVGVMRRHLSTALLLALSFACKKPAPAAPAPAADALDAGADEDVKPVYAAGETVPLAQQLCDALYEVQADRRAACCSSKPSPGLGLSQCVLTVSAALRSGAVSLEAKSVAACAAAQTKRYEGCAWVGPAHPSLPTECADLLHGTLKAGAVCRSSLECLDGSFCLGVGPTQPGKCSPPKSDGQACRLSVDALAGYARQDEELHHPECAGYCGHYKCAPRTAPGGACHMASECPGGQHCDGNKCVAGAAAAAGEACVGGACADGLSCVSGKCAAPLPTGAACKSDAECTGGCIPATHVCGQRCDAN
jgi:hypothetical protein